MISGDEDKKYEGPDSERLVYYCRKKLEMSDLDYFVFGHRHLPIEIELPKNARYINLGDWIDYNTYAIFDGDKLTLSSWDD